MAEKRVHARFRETASDRMERLSLLWLDIEQGSEEAMASLLRELHTHKGDASMSGFSTVASVTHALEDAVNAIASQDAPSPDDGDLFFEATDLLTELLGLAPDVQSSEATAMIAQLSARAQSPGSSLAAQRARVSTPPPAPAAQDMAPPALGDSAGALAPSIASEQAAQAPGKQAARGESSVRVQSGQLDRMREIIGELLLARGRLDTSAAKVRKERESAQRDRGSVADSELAHRLERSLGGLESDLRDDAVHLSNLIEALDDLTSALRMLPVSELVGRYPRYVRELAQSLGKRAQLQIVGQSARLDRELLNALDEPLLHLVRNAVDHGIESEEERVRAGKPSTGLITLTTRLLGNSLEIRLSDDGSGIDIGAVRTRARSLGLLSDENIDDQAALQTLLAPGMTTRSSLSSVSGRGIGLDVVDSGIRALHGKLEIHTKLGQGSTFTLTVPLSSAISMVLTFRVGKGIYALPAAPIESIERESEQEYVESLDGPAIRYRDQTVPLINLQERLGEATNSSAPSNGRLMFVRDGDQLVALSGGRDHMQREAVLKPAGTMLRKDGLVTAGCPLSQGEVALMLNIAVLQGRSASLPVGMPAPKQHVALIADDSPIIRSLLSETLRAYGMEVIEAEDGADALLKLEERGRADILVTDLDMPKIDGIKLIRAIRRRPGARMPAIVVSTRGSKEDQLAAIEAGADAYLVKTSFTRDGLWSMVSKYLRT